MLRVPVLYGEAEQPAESAVNVLMDSVWKAQEGSVKMDHWAIRYPTNTEDVGRVCQGRYLCLFSISSPGANRSPQTSQRNTLKLKRTHDSPYRRSYNSPPRTSSQNMKCASSSLRLWVYPLMAWLRIPRVMIQKQA